MPDPRWVLPPSELRTISRYRLLFEIGRGGMGTVFVARDPEGGLAAVKTLGSLDHTREAEVAQLIDEARVLSKLDHPRIVRFIESGLADALPFLVMEYVHGEPLSAIIDRKGALSHETAAWIGAEICSALKCAHELEGPDGDRLGLVIRDIAPQNILVGYDGEPKLVDFGIAWLRDREQKTKTGLVKGRLRYMSPEQRDGQSLDARSDLYSLGAVIREATLSDPSELLSSRLGAGILIPEAPKLAVALRRATSTHRQDRFDSAEQLEEAFRACCTRSAEEIKAELADLLSSAFGDSKKQKEALLDEEDLSRADTQAHELPVPKDIPSRPPPAEMHLEEESKEEKSNEDPVEGPSRTTSLAVLYSFIALTIFIVASVWLSGRPDTSAKASKQKTQPAEGHAVQRVCIVAEPDDTVQVAARLVADLLERARAFEVVHAYRPRPPGFDDACERLAATQRIAVDAQNTEGHWRISVLDREDNSTMTAARSEDAGKAAIKAAREVIHRLQPTAQTQELTLPASGEALIHLAKAREMLLIGKYREAIPFSERALAVDPNLEDAYLVRAFAMWWSGMLDQEKTREGVLTPPANIESPRLGRALVALEKMVTSDEDGATDLAHEIVEDRRSRDDPYLLYLAGEILFHGIRPGQGIVLLRRALELEPQLRPAIYHIKRDLLARRDILAANDLASRWERVEPYSLDPEIFKAQISIASGQYDEAKARFSKMLERYEGEQHQTARSEAVLGLVEVEALQGNEARALERAKAALSDPSVQMSHALLTTAYAIAIAIESNVDRDFWRKQIGQRSTSSTSISELRLQATIAIVEELGRVSRSDTPLELDLTDLPRSYRVAPLAQLLSGLVAHRHHRIDLLEGIIEFADARVVFLLEGLLEELRGDRSSATAALEQAVENSADGELDCVAESFLASFVDGEAEVKACEHILFPAIPTPFCFVLRRDCR